MKKSSATILGVLLFSAPALATEGGTQNYPIGVNTAANGNAPPPGTLEYYNYSLGNWNESFAGASGKNAVPGFGLNVEVNAARVLYTWKNLKIGRFHYVSGFVVPFGRASLSVPGAHVSKIGFPYIDIQNYLAYVAPNHKTFLLFGSEYYIPVGFYNKYSPLNLGSNYYTFAPNASVTWNTSDKLELTAASIVEFKTKNRADNYQSGRDFDIDYAANYKPFSSVPNLGFGVQGYFYKQFTSDIVNGRQAPDDGNRGREFGIGPQVRWDIPFGAFVLKFQHEFAVENRPRGDKVWFQFAFPLTGRPKAPSRPIL